MGEHSACHSNAVPFIVMAEEIERTKEMKRNTHGGGGAKQTFQWREKEDLQKTKEQKQDILKPGANLRRKVSSKTFSLNNRKNLQY